MRRTFLRACAAALFVGSAAAASAQAPQPDLKVLRYAFRAAETGFDPSQLSDIYSRAVTSHVFEALYTYDPLARPAQVIPLIAAAMPETSADFKTFTIRLRPGIFFADDPAFKGKPREVTAQDFVYTFKRFADPALKSPNWSGWEEAGLLGLAALRQQAIKDKKPFAYDTEIEACARSTATPCRSRPRSRARAWSNRCWPATTCAAPWRARWPSTTAAASPSTRSALGPSC